MKLHKRIHDFFCKLWSLKVAMFIVATFALYQDLVSEWVWLASALLLIGGREVAKIMAGRIGIGK